MAGGSAAADAGVAKTVSAAAAAAGELVGLPHESRGLMRRKSVFSYVSSVFCRRLFPRCSQLSPFRSLLSEVF